MDKNETFNKKPYIWQTLIKYVDLKVEKPYPNVLFVKNVEQSLPLLIVSDIHFDSLKCDHESLKHHFDQIKAKDGQIIIAGDLLDVMGTYRDPRSKPQEINPVYYQKGRSYLDLVVEDIVEFLKPYKDNILLISEGNHESNIKRRHDTDVLERIVWSLNQSEGSKVYKGQYAGWIHFQIRRKGSKTTQSFTLNYHHGKGGNAKRSKGILYSQLDAMEHPDADMIVSGHDHNKIYDPSNVRRRICTRTGRTYHDTVHWLKTGSYKRSSDYEGWEVQKGFMPKRMGGWFVDLDFVRKTKTVDGVPSEIAYIEPTVYEAVPVR